MFHYWRFVFAFMGFWGLAIVYMLRVNLSVAIVGMVNSTVFKPKDFTPECPVTKINESKSLEPGGEFSWSETEQTWVLSAFYWGYTIMQLASIFLFIFFNPKWIYGLSTLTTSILTFFVPLAANSGVTAMIILRFLMGICEGPTYPALYALSGRWILGKESSIVIAVINCGATIGTVLGQTLTGIIIKHIGWTYVFYIMATSGCVWFCVFAITVFDRPINHPFISDYEKNLLVDSLPHNRPNFKAKQSPVPWKSVLTSKAYFAYLSLTVSFNFTWYTMINCLPLYIGTVLGFDISQNGAISSLPYIFQLIFGIGASAGQDYIKSKNIISTTKIRKLFACPGMFLSSVILYCVIFTGCDVSLTIGLVCLSIAMLGCSGSVSGVNLLDLSPAHAGPLLAVGNVFNSLCGIVAPIIKNFYTRTGETRDNWENVFITTSAIMFIGAFVFMLFGSASPQPWAISTNTKKPVLGYDTLDSDSIERGEDSERYPKHPTDIQ